MPDHNYFANLIWQIADLLRGLYRPPQYERVMLPVSIDRVCFDRERATFPHTVLAFIHDTRPKEYARLDVLTAATERSLALFNERRAHHRCGDGAGADFGSRAIGRTNQAPTESRQ